MELDFLFKGFTIIFDWLLTVLSFISYTIYLISSKKTRFSIQNMLSHITDISLSSNSMQSQQHEQKQEKEQILNDKNQLIWQTPETICESTPCFGNSLRVLNTITNSKVPFIMSDGKSVRWYQCGPTVYESSHMGHARNYLTFDIIRRILTDYFGYNITFVMNVTDIDDKIILRARRNHLLNEYKQEFLIKNPKQVIKDVITSYDEYVFNPASEKFQQYTVRSKENPKDIEILDQLKQHEYKYKTSQSIKESCMKIINEHKDDDEVARLLLEIASDGLAIYLDEKKGSAVCDQAIYRKHASRYEQEFFEDMRSLGVRDPDIITRVTEYMPEVIGYVQKIMDNGFGYLSNGSVYFDTNEFSKTHNYGKMCPEKVGNADLAADGEGALITKNVNTEKKHLNDFALWKKSKDGEPKWNSPWGDGRPGWHIECSAMASEILGDTLDIHSGGCDLVFPHHTNELAQAEAYYDSQQWVNYFLHCGHLHISGLKMSKSLKNFITIREALKTSCTSRQLRILYLTQSWHTGMNYSQEVLQDAISKEKTFREFFHNIKSHLRESGSINIICNNKQGWNKLDFELHNLFLKIQLSSHEYLLDNFDYPSVIRNLLTLITKTNLYLIEMSSSSSSSTNILKAPLLLKIANYITKILTVFGVINNDTIGFHISGESESSVLPKVLSAVSDFRSKIRDSARSKDTNKKDFLEECDDFRDNILPNLGIRLEDKKDGSVVWKLEDPVLLMREREEKIRNAKENKIKKLKNEIKKNNEKINIINIQPNQFFLQDEYKKNKFNINNEIEESKGWNDPNLNIELLIPTHNINGKEIKLKAKDKFLKSLKKHIINYNKILQETSKEELIQKNEELKHIINNMNEEQKIEN